MKRGRIIAAFVLVAGCVQPTGSHWPQPPTANRLRLEVDLSGLIDTLPLWDARPAVANATSVRQSVYVVKPGDGLRAIGETTGAGSEAIARANRLTAPFILAPGQILRIPAGRYHKVAAGETGIAIARAYMISWQAMVEVNHLAEPFILRVGQRLVLPDETGDKIQSRAAAFTLDIDDITTGGTPASETPEAIAAQTQASFAGRFIWPVAGSIVERFGIAGEGRVNRGVEIQTAPESEIIAAADGAVAFVGNGGSAGYGGLILINHGSGWISAYGRAGSATVQRGQNVKTGDVIGRVGTEARLHFGLRQDRKALDPAKYLTRR